MCFKTINATAAEKSPSLTYDITADNVKTSMFVRHVIQSASCTTNIAFKKLMASSFESRLFKSCLSLT